MTGTDLGDGARGNVARAVRHIRAPIFIIAIVNAKGERTAERFPIAHPGEDLDAVGFDLLSSAAAETALAKRKFRVYFFRIDFKMRRQSLDDGDQGFSVRFSRRCQFHGKSSFKRLRNPAIF